jgi:hypothetical protein
MRRILTLVGVLISMVFAQTITSAQGDETKIFTLENLWNQIQLSHDVDAMGKMLDEDLVLTDYDGTVMNRTQFLAAVRDKSYQ